jgi:hypothetical protein
MPDGRTQLFISSRDGGRDVYMLRLTPTGQPEREPERLTSGSNAHTTSIAPDASQPANKPRLINTLQDRVILLLKLACGAQLDVAHISTTMQFKWWLW